MGIGYICECGSCDYGFCASYGVGLMFPYVYAGTLDAARRGAYGKAAASFFEKHTDGAIDAGSTVYECPVCANLQCETSLDLYIKNGETEKPKGRWSIACPGNGIDYVTPAQLSNHYKLYMPHAHKCERCKSTMNALQEDAFIERIEKHALKCPECGGELGNLDNLMWD